MNPLQVTAPLAVSSPTKPRGTVRFSTDPLPLIRPDGAVEEYWKGVALAAEDEHVIQANEPSWKKRRDRRRQQLHFQQSPEASTSPEPQSTPQKQPFRRPGTPANMDRESTMIEEREDTSTTTTTTIATNETNLKPVLSQEILASVEEATQISDAIRLANVSVPQSRFERLLNREASKAEIETAALLSDGVASPEVVEDVSQGIRQLKQYLRTELRTFEDEDRERERVEREKRRVAMAKQAEEEMLAALAAEKLERLKRIGRTAREMAVLKGGSGQIPVGFITTRKDFRPVPQQIKSVLKKPAAASGMDLAAHRPPRVLSPIKRQEVHFEDAAEDGLRDSPGDKAEQHSNAALRMRQLERGEASNGTFSNVSNPRKGLSQSPKGKRLGASITVNTSRPTSSKKVAAPSRVPIKSVPGSSSLRARVPQEVVDLWSAKQHFDVENHPSNSAQVRPRISSGKQQNLQHETVKPSNTRTVKKVVDSLSDYTAFASSIEVMNTSHRDNDKLHEIHPSPPLPISASADGSMRKSTKTPYNLPGNHYGIAMARPKTPDVFVEAKMYNKPVDPSSLLVNMDSIAGGHWNDLLFKSPTVAQHALNKKRRQQKFLMAPTLSTAVTTSESSMIKLPPRNVISVDVEHLFRPLPPPPS